MTARVKKVWKDYARGFWWREWYVDPVLAVGGDHDGHLLPVYEELHRDIVVRQPTDLSIYFQTGEIEPSVSMEDLTEVYHRYDIFCHPVRGVYGDLFPVYVGQGATPDDAVELVRLIFLWNLLYVKLEQLGVLWYFIALRNARETFDKIEQMAKWQQELKQMRDELEEGSNGGDGV